MLLIVGCDSDPRKTVILKDVNGIRFLVDENPRIYRPDELRVIDTVLRVGEFTIKNQCVQLVHGSETYTPILEDASIIATILANGGVEPEQKWEVFGGPWDGLLKATVKQCPPPYFYLTGAAQYLGTSPPPPPLLPSPPPRPFDPPRR